MSKTVSHGLKEHTGYARSKKGTRSAGVGKRKNVSEEQGSVANDAVERDLGMTSEYGYYAFDFPCYPLEIADYLGHYFLPVEAFMCQS